MSKRLMIILAAVALATLAGCGAGSDGEPSARNPEASPDPVPWSEVVDLAKAQEGEYEKVASAVRGGAEIVGLTEWVTFDLDAPFIDRRIGLGRGLQHEGPEGTKEDPTARFLYTEDAILMLSNLNMKKLCGTRWVDMPAAMIEEVTGLALDPKDVFAVEPLDVLAAAQPPARAKASTQQETVYEISVPGTTGLTMASTQDVKPQVIRRLQEQQVPAEVRVPRDEGPIEIELDLETAMEAVRPGSAAQGALTVTWTVTAPLDLPEPKLPTDVAHASCLK